MTGFSGQEYAGQYEVDARRKHGARYNLGGPPGRMILGFLVALVVIYLGVELLGARSAADANGSILKASGCAAYNIEPVNFEPSMPLEAAEDAVREKIDERNLRAEDGAGADQTFQPGALYWAEYGFLSRPTQRRSPDPQTSDRHWVFIFEDERDAPWYSTLWRRPSGPRFTVIYSPDQGRISSYCGGYSS
ncbi:MAG: hypothetical protein EA415_12750 [Sphaerobacteraceae bacterium]|nr:MAG: hypothetical protein EA415_12750 [Sphaerobacteraceae bacterium]